MLSFRTGEERTMETAECRRTLVSGDWEKNTSLDEATCVKCKPMQSYVLLAAPCRVPPLYVQKQSTRQTGRSMTTTRGLRTASPAGPLQVLLILWPKCSCVKRKPCMLGPMSSSGSISVHDGSYEKLLSCLMGLDQYQLEEFKLGLQAPQLLLENSRPIPWASLKAAGPADLLCLLSEYLTARQIWDVTLHIFENMQLTSLCKEMRAKTNEFTQAQEPHNADQERPGTPGEEAAHRRRYRERMKAKILAMWDSVSWPEDHIYLCNVTAKEHEELRRLLGPNRAGAQPRTIVLEGGAGVGKSTLAMKAVLHWAEGVLFQDRFSYVFFISCHKVKEMADTTLAGLLSQDWPDSQAPTEEFMGHPERLLFVIDGFEEMVLSPDLDNSPPCSDWYRQLPVARILLHLLKKELAPTATLLVTARDYGNGRLKGLLLNPWFVLLSGFTEGDREEYFTRFFGDYDQATKILRKIRKMESLFRSCSAPLVCWAVCSCLKRRMVRSPYSRPGAEAATSLYTRFFSGLSSAAAASASGQSRPGQWRALCSLAAQGMWLSHFTFPKEDVERWHLEAPLVESLLRRNILRKVGDCEDCVAFTHHSFQEFLGAVFYVLRGARGSLGGGSTRHQEMRALLSDAFLNTNVYWNQMVLFLFGLVRRDLARELEDALRCEVSRRVRDELLDWAEDLEGCSAVSVRFEFLLLFQCLHETQDEDFVRQILSRLLEADLDIRGSLQLRVSSFCLKHCQKLSKLRLSVSSPIPQTELTFDLETPGAKVVDLRTRQWQDICSVLRNGNMRELDLSDSKLNASSMKRLCYELRNPRCRLQKLTCRSVSPVRVLKELVLVLHGNHRLTHLDLSCNNLGITVSAMIFRTLRHSACNLQYLWSDCLTRGLLGRLESCGLTAWACHQLFAELGENSSLRFLSLGDNNLSNTEVKRLQGPFGTSRCPLKELSLEKCNLSVASCRDLALLLTSAQGVTRLCLGLNPLQDDGVEPLCGSLAHPDCVLERLVLSCCRLGAPSCGHLSDALLRSRTLTHLSLRRNELGDAGVARLCAALRRPRCRLRSLDLSACSLTAEGCQELADALKRNPNVKTLDIGENDVQDDGVKRLCEVLKCSNCTLSTLGLERCNLTRGCCQHLSSALGSSKSLVNLDLSGNDLGPEGVSTLWKSLEKPTCTLRKLRLEEDLYSIVKAELEKLQEKGSSLRIKCRRWIVREDRCCLGLQD
ncbi:NACHT, LRR and PYD domains-containing protein 13 isoform X1 [Camelus ferus]|uniref:NACHT, LRR and PYD domains-containing protein 13 isoform X1 n=3 Tax=Camelus ferus TaxID=419612 RepID=A0A8B8TM94_CAMFR|nr:NACHT, LRR and PYD domains-containing protein 13 isoform X1 [Camelus ferus]XP_032343377.1 NACHT, LRR and PYD domains-containing protein 13 isoform X1 [Camelus ferus]